jgi:hypothetical protein
MSKASAASCGRCFGYYLLLGLEFLIAADIIETLMKTDDARPDHPRRDCGHRTVISYSLNAELAPEPAREGKAAA